MPAPCGQRVCPRLSCGQLVCPRLLPGRLHARAPLRESLAVPRLNIQSICHPGGPALNALATIMLVLSFVVAGLGFLGYRWLSRGERIDRQAALTTIAGA